VISVLIPTYNCGPYLRDSLDSILGQTLPPGEVIVVDDGSTDETPDVLASYGDCIRVVPGRHEGLPAARNLCLQHARGEWIAFHDADDVARPDRLARHRAFLAETPDFDAVFANGERMDGAGRVVRVEHVQRAVGQRLDARVLFEGFPIYFQGALVPRHAFEAAGEFDAQLRVQPDIDYAYRLFAHCRAGFVDEVVFDYRWHTTNNSRDRLGSREDIARILERLDGTNPQAAELIGRRELRERISRHHYRIARVRLAQGDRSGAERSLARALAMRPWSARSRLLQLRMLTSS
jgi:glycosyltransferase involved in cell wall biosynthesis